LYADEYKPRCVLDVANTRMIIPSSYEGDMKIVQIEKPIRRILKMRGSSQANYPRY